MLLDLKFSIGTLGIGSGAFIAALYGMNLKNFLEESTLGFWGISGWSATITALVFVYGLSKLRKVQRLSMWGEGGHRGRNWRDEDAIGHRDSDWVRRERQRRLSEDIFDPLEERRTDIPNLTAISAAAKAASRTASKAAKK